DLIKPPRLEYIFLYYNLIVCFPIQSDNYHHPNLYKLPFIHPCERHFMVRTSVVVVCMSCYIVIRYIQVFKNNCFCKPSPEIKCHTSSIKSIFYECLMDIMM